MTELSIQHIPLQGQPNFRDLGGYRTADGRTIKPGLIYRSGELSKLTDEDIAGLQELGIRTVVDFRSAPEIDWRGKDRLPDGAQYVALTIESGNLFPIIYNVVETGDTSQLPDNALVETNRAIVRDATDQISDLFKILSDPANLPLVNHCTHGKDRTGVASAIILMALGVPAETAEADYLKSNFFRRNENKKELEELRQVIAARRGLDPSEVDMTDFRPLLYLEPSYFAAALDEINEQYGSFASYLENGLGIDADQIKAMRDQFTG